MTWDDELEDLTQRVFDAYGDGEVAKAYYRALMAAPALDDVDNPFHELCAEAIPEHGHSKFVDGHVTSAYFKEELRKLLTPH